MRNGRSADKVMYKEALELRKRTNKDFNKELISPFKKEHYLNILKYRNFEFRKKKSQKGKF